MHHTRVPAPRRTTALALWIGIGVSLLLTLLVWLGGGIPASVAKLPDQGASWYYWKLPEPTFWSRLSVWSLYLAHQGAIWACIWWAQKHRPSYTAAFHPINWLMIGINLLFIGLHFVQTYIWYDGLAQDVSIWSSQGAVTVMLILILAMETPRRGLFFGKKVSFRQEFIRIIKRYHGYFFAWAAIYTFWYHPLEATIGHLMGFFYMFLLLFQSSLVFNRAHLNRWWTFFLEFMVLIHGVVVAAVGGKGMWPMFLFGFLGIVVITQLHGLPIGRWAKRAVYVGFVVGVLAVYGLTDRGLGRIDEVIRIPLIEYLAVFIVYGLFLGTSGLIRLATSLGGGRAPIGEQ